MVCLTKTQGLTPVKGYSITATPCVEITSVDVVAFATEIKAQLQTVQN